MSKSIVTAAILLLVTLAAEDRARAQTSPVQKPIAAPPSPFEAGLSGFGMGIAAGLAGGYLVARSNGWQTSDWRPIVAGGAIGALAGGSVGLTLGFMDSASAAPGRGYLIVRDMAYGGTFGAVFGALVGGLAALETNHVENVAFGAAIGTLSGTALGAVIGSQQRNPWAAGGAGLARPVGWNVGLAPCRAANGTLSIGPRLFAIF